MVLRGAQQMFFEAVLIAQALTAAAILPAAVIKINPKIENSFDKQLGTTQHKCLVSSRAT
jgi:hypothetical protein